MAHAILGKSKLVIILPPAGKERFYQSLSSELDKNQWDFIGKLVQNIDSERAKASKEKDVRMIKTFIQTNLDGFLHVNTLVADGLREWFQGAVLGLVDTFPAKEKGTSKHASMLYDVAKFCSSQNMLHDAERLFGQASVIYQKLGSINYFHCQSNMSSLLSRMGRMDDAVALASKDVDDHVRRFGHENSRTLESQEFLGSILRKSGKLVESEKTLRKALLGFRKIQDPMSQHIRVTMSCLADTLRDAGKYDEPKTMYQDMIKWETTKFGRSHPTTLCTVSDYARCLALEQNHEEAIKLYKEALPILRTTYGGDDEDVQNCTKWLKESRAQLGETKQDV